MSQPPVPKKRTGASGSKKSTFTKPSRLIAAAKAGEDNLIQEYMEDPTKKIDINKVDSLGQSSMHWAAHSGYPTTIETIHGYGGSVNLQDKTDVSIKNNEGKTPFDLAKTLETKKILYVPSIDLEDDCEDSRDSDDD
ncbi:Osteoclast-stimulating factor [Entamoeba marina]